MFRKGFIVSSNVGIGQIINDPWTICRSPGRGVEADGAPLLYRTRDLKNEPTAVTIIDGHGVV